MLFKLLSREMSEIFSNMFWIRGEGSVYFNIRGEESVIQIYLRGGEGTVIYSWTYDICQYLVRVSDTFSIISVRAIELTTITK